MNWLNSAFQYIVQNPTPLVIFICSGPAAICSYKMWAHSKREQSRKDCIAILRSLVRDVEQADPVLLADQDCLQTFRKLTGAAKLCCQEDLWQVTLSVSERRLLRDVLVCGLSVATGRRDFLDARRVMLLLNGSQPANA